MFMTNFSVKCAEKVVKNDFKPSYLARNFKSPTTHREFLVQNLPICPNIPVPKFMGVPPLPEAFLRETKLDLYLYSKPNFSPGLKTIPTTDLLTFF